MARIGIDLRDDEHGRGVPVADDGPHVVPRGAGRIIPSVVAYSSAEAADMLVGEPADNFEAGGPVVRSIKRLMGRTPAKVETCREELERLLAEVDQSWKKWRSTEAVLEGGADLRVLREGRRDRGN